MWFSAAGVESNHFTYRQVSTAGADALIVANEDYTGVNPSYPAGTAGPKYADDYAATLDANGVSHDTWDVDALGVPHPLGVLSHFEAVVWESGDDRLPQEPEDLLTDTFLLGPVPDIAVAERQQYLTLAVRDFLNEGGKLIQAGETAQYQGLLGRSLGGIYSGLDGAPEQDCVVSRDFITDCGLLADDFAQYYLGARERVTFARPSGVKGTGRRLAGTSAAFGGQAVADNPLNEAGAFSLTSDVLTADRFPRFAGKASSSYVGAAGVNPLGPVEGRRYAGALHADSSYQRLGRTIDLTDVSAAEAPTLSMSLSFSTTVTFHHRDRRGGAVGHRRLDHAARHTRRHDQGTAVAVPGGPADHASVPAPLPDARPTVRSQGHHRGVERLQRRVGRLAQRLVRPVALRRPTR